VRRVFWIALGASVGVLVVHRLSRVVDRFTPAGIAEGVSGVGERLSGAVGDFVAAVGDFAAEREIELRTALGLEDSSEGGP
jgi:hypothetical protein